MKLKNLFSCFKSKKKIIPTLNEFRLIDMVDEADLIANNQKMVESYSMEWKNKPQSSLCFMAYPLNLKAGGLRTILMLLEAMSVRWGLKNYICFYPRYKQSPKKLKVQDQLIAEMHKEFPNLIFEIIPYCENYDDFPEVDIAFCNWWITAYPLVKFNKCKQKYYLIQDYEPLFRIAGTTFALTEETYKFGFIGIANSPALSQIYQSYGNAPVYTYLAGIDHNLYYPLSEKEYTKEVYKIVFYGRPSTPRNDFEILAETFKLLKAKLGNRVEIYSVGEDYDVETYSLGGIVTNLGMFSDMKKLASLYRNADIGISFISTPTYSYQHLEFMASGLCLVTNEQKGIAELLNDNENAVVCPPLPKIIASRIIDLINHPDLLKSISERGIKTAQTLDWNKCFDGICDFMLQSKV